MKHFRNILLVSYALMLTAGAAESATHVRGIAGRLPVYASTNTPRTAVAHLPGSAVLEVRGAFAEAEWVPVEAADAVSVWLYKDLVRDNEIIADKSQVRAGAGMAFPAVASLKRGTRVEVRGTYGDWLKIKPPVSIALWVLRDDVETFAGDGTAGPEFYAAIIGALTNDSPEQAHDQPAAALPPPELAGYALDASAKQGERVKLNGILDLGGVDALAAPFRIVIRNDEGETVPFYNLLAPEATYGTFVGADVRVEGTRWYVKGVRLPFILPVKMQKAE